MSAVISRSIDSATVVPGLVMLFEDEAEAGAILHPILGREYPDVTLRPASAASGVLRLFFLTHEEAAAARRFHMAAAVFSLASDTMPWLPARYVAHGQLRRVQQEQQSARWIVEIGYQEVPA